MKRLVVDLDETLTLPGAPGECYAERAPNLAMIAQVAEYRRLGFEIVIHTARNMRTFGGSLGKINAVTLPIILAWLDRHHVPYDEVHVGKPWCGHDGFYVDDRAVRPAEFLSLNLEQIQRLLRPSPS